MQDTADWGIHFSKKDIVAAIFRNFVADVDAVRSDQDLTLESAAALGGLVQS